MLNGNFGSIKSPFCISFIVETREEAKWLNWKKSGIILVSILAAIILIIPSVIVIPFIEAGENETTQSNRHENDSILELDSSFTIKVFRTASSQVEDVPLEVYVARVVASEMPADFEMEALKAQALAARTFLVKHLLQGSQAPENSHVKDTVEHQVYKNEDELRQLWGTDYSWKMKRIKQAVAETQGEIITYEGEPITAAFFSTSNGFTENSEDYWQNSIPYLRSVQSPWDEESPKFLNQKIVALDEVENKLGVDLSQQPIFSDLTRTESNRVETVTIGDKTFTGREVREALGLHSSDFSIVKKDHYLIFTTKGYGHGIGMSQYGANGMAKEGKTYKEIVQYYYKGATISDITPYLERMESSKQ